MLPESILLVDDEAELRTSLREALQSDGYTVEEADGAEMALGLIAHTHYAVIITDLNMPAGKSGFELIEAVKAKDPKTLCVVITGFATLSASLEAIKHGAYDFLQKPFKLEELEAVLDRALDFSRLQRRVEAYQSDLESRVLARVAEMKTFHEDVLCLNGLLRDALGESEEGPTVRPFLDYLQARFAPDGFVMFLPGSGGSWSIFERRGDRPWVASRELPSAEGFTEVLDWSGEGGYSDGYLVPLCHAHRALGALFLGFETRSTFSTEDPVFELWCNQLIAALHGLHRTRAYAAALAAKRV